ncbi:MAG: hypothetical protein ACAH80_12065 [Alphaproteobacteria bacterium]
MFRYILIVLLLLLPQTAGADCYMPEPPGAQEGTVAATWPAKHVEDGDIGGCLLKFNLAAGGEWLGYTRYDFICKLSASEKITLIPDFACCDTGDHGDYACGVKPRGMFDTMKRTNITLAPALPDARAIPELVKAALGGKLRDANAAIRLKQYLGVPELAEEVKKQITPLENALDDNTITDAYVRAQVAGLLAAAKPETQHKTKWLIEFFKGDIGYGLTDAQKPVLAALTADAASAEQFIPVLAQKLRSTDEDSRLAILSAITAYGAAAKPHADALRDAFTTELPVDGDAMRTAPSPVKPADPVEAARYAAMMEQVQKDEAEKAKLARKLIPLLSEIACQGVEGNVTVGKNYPSSFYCPKTP